MHNYIHTVACLSDLLITLNWFCVFTLSPSVVVGVGSGGLSHSYNEQHEVVAAGH